MGFLSPLCRFITPSIEIEILLKLCEYFTLPAQKEIFISHWGVNNKSITRKVLFNRTGQEGDCETVRFITINLGESDLIYKESAQLFIMKTLVRIVNFRCKTDRSLRWRKHVFVRLVYFIG